MKKLLVLLFLACAVPAYAQVIGPAPKITLQERENSGVLTGAWRFSLDGNVFEIHRNTAAGGDFSTKTTPLSISAADVFTWGGGNHDFANGLPLNLGIAGTDFTAGGGLTLAAPILLADGSVTAPSMSFTNATGMGLFAGGPTDLRVAIPTGGDFSVGMSGQTWLSVTQAANYSITGQNINANGFLTSGSVQSGVTAALDADVTGVTIIGAPAVFGLGSSTKAPLVAMANGATTAAAALPFIKTRSTGTDANTTIVAGDGLALIPAYGADGTSLVRSGSIRYTNVGTVAATRVGGQWEFYTGTDAAPTVETLALTLGANQIATFAGAIVGEGSAQFGSASVLGWQARSRMTANVDGQVTLQNNNQDNFTRLNFGGTTSSFPALRRTLTNVEVVLADSSAYTTIAANQFRFGDGGAGGVLIKGSGTSVETRLGDDSAYARHTALVFQTTTALVALGAGGAATLGTVGGSGPATTTQNTWLLMTDSTGAAFWVPAWK